MKLLIALVLTSGISVNGPGKSIRTNAAGGAISVPGAVASFAFFEFAPATGTGMGAACACTTPTGAKGEAMTFTRASTKYCTKGNETSGIVNGDLVECASGQPTVMPGGDGSGGLGINIWEARTNNILRSQELDNAAWNLINAGGATLPVVTANFATAPDGTTTAERVQIGSVTGGTQFSFVYQDGCAKSTIVSGRVYIKGNGTSGTFPVGIANSGGSLYTVQALAYNPTTWTLIGPEAVPTGAVNAFFAIGNLGSGLGDVDRPAHDVLVWQADCQTGTSNGPPIKTTTVAATRVVETASLPFIRPTPTTGSASVIVVRGTGISNVDSAYISESAAGTYKQMIYVNSLTQAQLYVGNLSNNTLSLADTTGNHTFAGWWTPSNSYLIYDGSTTTGVGVVTGVVTDTMQIGGYVANVTARTNGTLKRVCLDPDATRCR